MPVFADIDPANIFQAIMNIMDNAVKYALPQGHITVAVGNTAQDEAFIEVVDDGPGIPKEQQTNILDRFYRVDVGRSREAVGTGLGLAIASWAVEINGGRIELESNEGHGSTYRVILPLHKEKIGAVKRKRLTPRRKM